MRLSRRGQAITSLEEWKDHAAPKGGDRHWQDGRSAKELAKAWCRTAGGPAPPEELVQLLSHHGAFQGVVIEEGWPEDLAPFDDLPGEPRNADLNLLCTSGEDRVVISVEAKADEPLGSSVAATREAASMRSKKSPKSAGGQRLTWLIENLLPAGTQGVDALPYQLLTGVAGTLAFARREQAGRALFLIHEFVNGKRSDGRVATSAGKLNANADRINAFVKAITDGTAESLDCGCIVGPIRVTGPSTGWESVALYLGKLRTDLATSSNVGGSGCP